MIRIFTTSFVLLLIVYFLSVCFFFKKRDTQLICEKVLINIVDIDNKQFVDSVDLISLLNKRHLNPIKKKMSTINTEKIEDCLLKNEMIESINVYKTPSGIIRIDIEQKTPILRIMGFSESFYIDESNTIMPISRRYAVKLPVACGSITREMAQTSLYPLALFLKKNKDWNDMIEQIYVYPDMDIEIIPRVGNFRILLGSSKEFEEKFERLDLFYNKIIPKVGWEKYKRISLKFKDQIICTKR